MPISGEIVEINEDQAKVKVLVNIFGGIAKCDTIAEGVIDGLEYLRAGVDAGLDLSEMDLATLQGFCSQIKEDVTKAKQVLHEASQEIKLSCEEKFNR